ncbi:MAG: serine aminopeptidase domain-containing protein [Planctomycetota bacterium]
MHRRSLAALALLACASCLTPPALIEPMKLDRENVLARYARGTESVAIEVEPGIQLRGVFVPSQPNGPVVLHLLESSGSVASSKLHFGAITRQLSDLGYASLVVDYTGIGLSDGSASVRNLERDALAMWGEAERRAHGAPIWIRATSLGAIPAAQLLAHGKRPARIVLIAPVLADSAVTRFAHAFHGPLAGVVAAAVFRDIADVDVVDELKAAKVPTIAVVSEDDALLSERDRQHMRAGLYPHGAVFLRDGGHMQLALDAHELLSEESRFFEACSAEDARRARADAVLAALDERTRALFPPESAARARLDAVCGQIVHATPSSVAAATLAIERPELAARMLWLNARRTYSEELSFDEWRHVLSLADPAGLLPIDLIERAARLRDFALDHGTLLVRTFDADDFARAARQRGLFASNIGWSTTMTFVGGETVSMELDGARIFQELLARGVPSVDAERQFVRVLLKAHRIPDRVRTSVDGDVVVEAKENGVWRVPSTDESPAGAEVLRLRIVQ